MRFYYFSFFGTILALVVSLVAAGVFWAVWRGALKRSIPTRAFLVSLPIFLVMPWAEELWIAYHFGQLCRKDAGVFIIKTVEVDGFYDDTTHWWRQLREFSNYQFVESRDNLTGTLWRVEREGDSVRHFKIDKPTARYHYRAPYEQVVVDYKIRKTERVVADSETGEVLARETIYARYAYWLYISLDVPVLLCPAPEESSIASDGSIYNAALKPTLSR
jgi:hypothetical protein